MKPLRIMPTAAPPPAMPAHTAMALDRSEAGKTLVRIDSVEGMIIAPGPVGFGVLKHGRGSPTISFGTSVI